MFYSLRTENLPTLQEIKDYVNTQLEHFHQGHENETEEYEMEDYHLEEYIGEEPLRVWIMETWNTHDEVLAPLVNAFSNVKNSELRLFAGRRFRIERILYKLNPWNPFASDKGTDDLARFFRDEPSPDIVVSTTCDGDIEHHTETLKKMLDKTTAHLFCVFHAAEWFNKGQRASIPLLQDWVKAGRVDFVGLSEHTSKYMNETALPTWGLPELPPVRTFPPVIPQKVYPDDNLDGEVFLSIQGDFRADQRDFGPVFNKLSGVIKSITTGPPGESRRRGVSLHVIGHGAEPVVPDVVRDFVFFHQEWDYPDYYNLLSNSYAILPMLPNDAYMKTKASSSVSAAMTVGVPIVASEELLKRYTFFPKDAAWLSQEGEHEMDTIKRVMRNESEYQIKKELVKAATERLIVENINNVSQWVKEALARRKQAPTDAGKGQDKDKDKGKDKGKEQGSDKGKDKGDQEKAKPQATGDSKGAEGDKDSGKDEGKDDSAKGADEKKPEDKKPEDKPDDKKPEENKAEENEAEEKKPEDNKKPEDGKKLDEDKTLEDDKELEDDKKLDEDKTPEDDKKPEEKKPSRR